LRPSQPRRNQQQAAQDSVPSNRHD
jgi:hypothetical protein